MPAKKVDNDFDFQGFKIINGKQEGFNPAVSTITAATTLTAAHHTVILNAATAATVVVVTLPNPTTCSGRVYCLQSRQGIMSLAVTGASTVLDGGVVFSRLLNGRSTQLISDGTNWRSLVQTVVDTPITRPQQLFTDFHTIPTITSDDFTLVVSGTGAGVVSGASSTTNRIGVIELSTGSTATGTVHVGDRANGSPVVLGGGSHTFAAAVDLKALSTALQRFQVVVGLYDTLTGPLNTDAVMFLYDEGGATTLSPSPNWQRCIANNSARTFTTTTVAAKLGWVNFRIEINANATNAEFFIDGASVGAFTTGIPAGSARATGFGVAVFKTVGTTPALVHSDWMLLRSDFSSNPRGAW